MTENSNIILQLSRHRNFQDCDINATITQSLKGIIHGVKILILQQFKHQRKILTLIPIAIAVLVPRSSPSLKDPQPSPPMMGSMGTPLLAHSKATWPTSARGCTSMATNTACTHKHSPFDHKLDYLRFLTFFTFGKGPGLYI